MQALYVLIKELKRRHTPPIVRWLLEQLPPRLEREEASWRAASHRSKSGVVEVGMSPVSAWTMCALTEHASIVSVVRPEGGVRLLLPPNSQLDCAVTLEVEPELSAPLQETFAALTGQPFAPSGYLRMLHHRNFAKLVESGEASVLRWLDPTARPPALKCSM
jgi:hypothetical protein